MSPDALHQGRESFAAGDWSDAYDSLSGAGAASALEPEDLELLATSAYMLGRDAEYFGAVERAHHAYLQTGQELRAARCAFWTGMHHFQGGDVGRATGWLSRAQRLVDAHGEDCVEKGYLLLPLAFRHDAAGRLEAGAAVAGEAAAIGERFGDRDLFALGVHLQGHLLVNANRVEDGLRYLDEAMVAVTSGELSPIVSGIVYCGVILGCQHAYEPRRAQEWTAALAQWCERQPDMVAFTGRCMVHRAELMLLKGRWSEALEEARRAGGRAAAGNNRAAAGEAAYLQGEVHRLRGELEPAQAAYREADRLGREPEPGMALLRLAQGNAEAAAAAVRRALAETADITKRTRLLPACVEIMVAVGDVAAARDACAELEGIARGHGSDVLDGIVAQAQGALELAVGDPAAALPALRRAWRVWQQVEAPYETARVRVLMSSACRALGDGDAAELERQEARAAFERLGARPELGARDGGAHGLTARELQVLRLVAAGATNKAIAAELVLSERTIDRHVSNIFAKLGVYSRTAATAYAYEHQLV